ncbi:MAG: hypothetical protein GYB21_16670 [Oceanospirillales bacterium]|nr:hypothetical protein [Oceanospirillales bacterium]
MRKYLGGTLAASLLLSTGLSQASENQISISNTSDPNSNIEILQTSDTVDLDQGAIVAGKEIKQAWEKVDGQATSIGIGPQGDIWVVGTDGYLYKRDTAAKKWNKLTPPSSSIRFKQVTVGKNEIWALTTTSKIYRYGKSGFKLIRGELEDISAGADGSVWGVNSKSETFKWSGTSFVKTTALASRVAALGDGSAIVVGNGNTLYRGSDSKWTSLGISARDLAIGADKTIWYVSTQKVNANGNAIYRLDSISTKQVTKDSVAAATAVAVTPDGKPWAINANGEIYYAR